MAFLNTNNEMPEREIKIPFIINTKNEKILRNKLN